MNCQHELSLIPVNNGILCFVCFICGKASKAIVNNKIKYSCSCDECNDDNWKYDSSHQIVYCSRCNRKISA